MVPVLMLSAALAADCPEGALEQAVSHAAALEAAWSRFDEDGIEASGEAIRALLPCADAALTPRDAAIIHRAWAMYAFFDGEHDTFPLSWGAVRTLTPAWRPSTSLIPDGHPLRVSFDAAEPSTTEVPLDRAPPGGWTVDGIRGNAWPEGRAFILQGFGARGEVVHTGYHLDGHGILELPLELVSASRVVDPHDPRAGRGRTIRTVGTIGAGALLAGGGASLLMAQQARVQASQAGSYAEASRQAARANTLSTVGAGLAVGGAGVGVVSWVVRW